MALSIKDSQADDLARILVKLTGETLTEAVIQSLAERLERERRKRGNIDEKLKEIKAMVKRFSAGYVIDERTPDAIIGYDDNGLPQ